MQSKQPINNKYRRGTSTLGFLFFISSFDAIIMAAKIMGTNQPTIDMDNAIQVSESDWECEREGK